MFHMSYSWREGFTPGGQRRANCEYRRWFLQIFASAERASGTRARAKYARNMHFCIGHQRTADLISRAFFSRFRCCLWSSRVGAPLGLLISLAIFFPMGRCPTKNKIIKKKWLLGVSNFFGPSSAGKGTATMRGGFMQVLRRESVQGSGC